MPAGTCPYCKQQINLPAERGEQVQCPSCGHPLRVVATAPRPQSAEATIDAEVVNSTTVSQQPSLPLATTKKAGISGLSIVLVLCGAVASLFCLGSGVCLLSVESVAGNTVVEAIAHCIGAYCIGLAFFVGPVLIGIARMLEMLEQKRRE